MALAILGVTIALSDGATVAGPNAFLGDIMALLGAMGWALIALIARTTSFSTLKPDAPTVGSMFGTNHTLYELRNSFLLAEQERTGGVSAHVSPFAGPNDLGAAIKKAGLTIPTIDLDDLAIRYADAFVLMHELGRMGESNAAAVRRLR